MTNQEHEDANAAALAQGYIEIPEIERGPLCLRHFRCKSVATRIVEGRWNEDGHIVGGIRACDTHSEAHAQL